MACERDLLFGVLALQNNFVAREVFLGAFSAWIADKSRPLADYINQLGKLSRRNFALLSDLVEVHLEQHGGSPQQSLAAVSSIESVREALEEFQDSELRESLCHLSAARYSRMPESDGDPYLTLDSSLTPSGGSERFRILRFHRRGGLGKVSIARDEELHREVAFKEIRPEMADDPRCRERFTREARITGGLEHPCIVPVYAMGRHLDGRPYYAMRFIQGESLTQALTRFHGHTKGNGDRSHAKSLLGPSRQSEFRSLLRRLIDVCQAIEYSHARGIVHRDLKPDNIMLGDYGETLVLDWGLAKPLRSGKAEGQIPTSPPDGNTPLLSLADDSEGLTHMGSIIGTFGWMSPEQARGQIDKLGPLSDVYSLGATLYSILTGKAAVHHENHDVMKRQTEHGDFPSPRSLNSDVPRPLEAICLKAMALQPQDRYSRAAELESDLEKWLADEPVSAYREPWLARARRLVRRHQTLVVGGGAALLIGLVASLALGGILAFYNQTLDLERKQAIAARDLEREMRTEQRDVLQYLSDIAMARLKGRAGVSEVRLEMLEKVLKYHQKIAAREMQDSGRKRDLVDAHHSIGDLLASLGQHEKSRQAYQKALEVLQHPPFEVGDAEEESHIEAMLLVNLSEAQFGSGNHLEGFRLLSQASKKWNELIEEYPDNPKYIHASLDARLNQASRFARFRDGIDALSDDPVLLAELFGSNTSATGAVISEYNKLVADYDHLAKKSNLETSVRISFQMMLTNYANLLDNLNRHEQALLRAEQAVEIGTQVVDSAKTTEGKTEAGEFLANSLNTRGVVLRHLRRDADALRDYQNAVQLLRRLVKAHPGELNYRNVLSRSMHNIGNLQMHGGKLEEASKAFDEVVLLRSQLVTMEPDNLGYLANLANTFLSQGDVLRRQKQFGPAGKEYARGVEILRNLSFQSPSEFASVLAAAYEKFSKLSDDSGKQDESLKFFEEELPKLTGLANQQPLVSLHQLWGETLYVARRDEEAVTHYELAGEGARQISTVTCAYKGANVWGRCAELAKEEIHRQECVRQSLGELKRAVELGFSDYKHLISDPSLRAIQQEQEYKELAEKVRIAQEN